MMTNILYKYVPNIALVYPVFLLIKSNSLHERCFEKYGVYSKTPRLSLSSGDIRF